MHLYQVIQFVEDENLHIDRFVVRVQRLLRARADVQLKTPASVVVIGFVAQDCLAFGQGAVDQLIDDVVSLAQLLRSTLAKIELA
ncbi:hypothetical protein D3C86_1951710 [compost metagenome]